MTTPILLPVFECSKCQKPYVYRLATRRELVSPAFEVARDCTHRSAEPVPRPSEHSTPEDPYQEFRYLIGVATR